MNTQTYYLALEQRIPGSWGRGATPDDAKAAARKHGARRRRFRIFKIEAPCDKPQPYVDNFGTIHYWGQMEALS